MVTYTLYRNRTYPRSQVILLWLVVYREPITECEGWSGCSVGGAATAAAGRSRDQAHVYTWYIYRSSTNQGTDNSTLYAQGTVQTSQVQACSSHKQPVYFTLYIMYRSKLHISTINQVTGLLDTWIQPTKVQTYLVFNNQGTELPLYLTNQGTDLRVHLSTINQVTGLFHSTTNQSTDLHMSTTNQGTDQHMSTTNQGTDFHLSTTNQGTELILSTTN